MSSQRRWDSDRPVPWRRLVREWLLYAGIMAAVFIVFFRSDSIVGALIGIVVSGPLYIGLGFAMAKLGYQRDRLGQRSRRSSRTAGSTSGESGDSTADVSARAKPAPTRRTGAGSNRPISTSKRIR